MSAAAFAPAPFATLADWALGEWTTARRMFGLPKRSIWKGDARFDLSVPVAGGRADNPLGIAAGPHTQLAQNLVVGWLAGARSLELKTVQVQDQLEIARPCIEAPAEGYNVEWSQELRLTQSLEQYVSAWALVHLLAPLALGAEAAEAALAGTHFDASVGYDLAGVKSTPVARFLDGLANAGGALATARAAAPAAARAHWPERLPERIAHTVTLSSFHGCPAHEIEAIVEHLFERHGLNVVVKLNPTLLGFERVDALLHGPLGWHDVRLDRGAFERDLQWDAACQLLARLHTSAARRGLTLGVKLTNTLVVRNTRGRLAGEVVYLSGAPLHPIAMALASELAGVLPAGVPLALSAGVNAENFADAVACGFAPVTTCTDLLRPTGYRRLPRYLKALETELARTDSRDLADYQRARAGGGEAAARVHLRQYAERVARDPRYAAPAPLAAPVRPPLALVDCESCNQCALACPNGAITDVATPAVSGVESECERQWLVLADFCNDCGNCDTFCPQSGGPHAVKARLHTSRERFEADRHAHVVWLDAAGGTTEVRATGAPTCEWLSALASTAAAEAGALGKR